MTAPLFGPLIYFLFGINRIKTRARILEQRSLADFEIGDVSTVADAEHEAHQLPAAFSELARVSAAVTGLALTSGNRLAILHNGEETYPAMLEAIENARQSLYLVTYIWETNATGLRFVEALEQAKDRGVDVRVIIDGVGERYSKSRISKILDERGVRAELFLEPRLIPPSLHMNLRNHRKILIADGRVAFTGGMNLGDRHLAAATDNPDRVIDVHFRIEGPAVGQLERVFLEDWTFVTGESIAPTAADPDTPGDAVCRVAVDGPNEDLDKLVTILIGAVSAARRRVLIMNPYFLPPRMLMGALQAAALRGVEVAVVLPERNNLPYIHWASRHGLSELLRRGVRVYYQPAPFVHSKLFVVDDHYAQIGSANLDPRSLRLNFELAVEVFHEPFAQQLAEHIDQVRQRSRRVTREELDDRPLGELVRDAFCWLFTPYL